MFNWQFWTWTSDQWFYWVGGLLTTLATLFALGCNGAGLLSTVSSDMKELLKDPVVQKTLQDWSANADVTNPSIGFYLINGGELRAGGIIVRGNIQGAVGGGVKNDTVPSTVVQTNQ
jgi:hypothetical protein